mmetsp:Transcript_68841/g.163354  ORF Transcript_68841/g.163354 Transcript_68841/m.163354 type:complete len:245 (+) Transcript_68841:242-976(+)
MRRRRLQVRREDCEESISVGTAPSRRRVVSHARRLGCRSWIENLRVAVQIASDSVSGVAITWSSTALTLSCPLMRSSSDQCFTPRMIPATISAARQCAPRYTSDEGRVAAWTSTLTNASRCAKSLVSNMAFAPSALRRPLNIWAWLPMKHLGRASWITHRYPIILSSQTSFWRKAIRFSCTDLVYAGVTHSARTLHEYAFVTWNGGDPAWCLLPLSGNLFSSRFSGSFELCTVWMSSSAEATAG